MDKPTFDSEGYPSDETLEWIENWNNQLFNPEALEKHNKTVSEAIIELFDFVHGAYNCHYGKFVKEDGYYRIATGGWSGNESLIYAFQKTFAWTMLWLASVHGGGYYLRDPREERCYLSASVIISKGNSDII